MHVDIGICSKLHTSKLGLDVIKLCSTHHKIYPAHVKMQFNICKQDRVVKQDNAFIGRINPASESCKARKCLDFH